MKLKAFAVLVSIAVALPGVAARHARPLASRLVPGEPVSLTIEPLPDGRDIGLRALKQARTASANKTGRLNPTAIMDNRSNRVVVIPAAGSVRGNFGTFFRSDITFANWNTTAQKILIYWLPNGASSPVSFATTLPGDRPPFTIQDFVGTTLGQSGLGSLIFIPVQSNNAFDDNGAIDVFSRIWTPQPNASGTVSQPFPGVDPDHMFGEYEGFILGLRQDPSYRTNYGVVNLNDTALDFSVTVFPESAPAGTTLATDTFRLQPLTMTQRSAPGGNYTSPINIAVGVETNVANDDQSWTAYASSTDNTTGDGWVSIVSKDWDDETLDDNNLSIPNRAPRVQK